MFKPYERYKPSGVEWLSNVPEHWWVTRLKMAVQLTDRKVAADEEHPAPYIGMENIESRTGRLLPINPDVIPTGTANAFKAGNTLFGKLRPYLAKVCNPDFDGLCSTELLVLKSADLDRRLLLYSLLCDGFIKLVDSSTYGSKMPRASWEFVGDCVVPIAPPNEQRSIADFLDRETAKIDTLVAKKRTLIERLKEKRTALISRTVTRGLPPDAARSVGLDPHPKLKPSGIDWLGDVPEHWEVIPYKRVCTRVDVGIAEAATHAYCDDGVPIIRSTNVKPNHLDTSEVVHIEPWFAEKNRAKALHAGDLVTVRTGYPGTTSVIPQELDGCQCFTLVMSSPKGNACSAFFAYVFNSQLGRNYFEMEGWGTAQTNISVPIVQLIPVPKPPPCEQRAIADYLASETAKIDQMITKVETAIERLQEYRTALITAAVTGKIDVRGTAA